MNRPCFTVFWTGSPSPEENFDTQEDAVRYLLERQANGEDITDYVIVQFGPEMKDDRVVFFEGKPL